MRFTSDNQRKAIFAQLGCARSQTSQKSMDFARLGGNRFSELPDWAKKYTETPIVSVVQTKISEDIVPISRSFAALPYNERRYAVNDYLKNHPEIKSNPQVAVDNITLINVLMDYAEENGLESLDDINWSDIRSGGSYNDLRGSMGLASKRKYQQTRLSIDPKVREERIADIDRIVLRGGLTDAQKEMFARMREQYVNNDMSRHPKEIGSVWVGGNYVHGPRIRQPEEFDFIKNVDPSPKFYHFKDADKIPKTLPRGSKLVVGKLRKSGDWALQSTLIPKSSELGKSLIRR
jgi:hypothetical protein